MNIQLCLITKEIMTQNLVANRTNPIQVTKTIACRKRWTLITTFSSNKCIPTLVKFVDTGEIDIFL